MTNYNIHRVPEKLDHQLTAVTSSNPHRFSKFFYGRKDRQINSNIQNGPKSKLLYCGL